VLCGGTLSKSLTRSIGVRQGCPLSPSLFNLFLERIMTDALYNFDGRVSIGGRKICNLRFADGIDLIAGSMEELAELTTRLDTTSCKYGMEISAEKSKVLFMGVDSREQTYITV